MDARSFPPNTNVYAYYLPFQRGSNPYGMQVDYLTRRNTTDPATDAWRRSLYSHLATGSLPHASSSIYEARDTFSAFTEMERTATAAEVETLLRGHPDATLVFPEPRSRVIRRRGNLTPTP